MRTISPVFHVKNPLIRSEAEDFKARSRKNAACPLIYLLTFQCLSYPRATKAAAFL
jgi:hypothetical protein